MSHGTIHGIIHRVTHGISTVHGAVQHGIAPVHRIAHGTVLLIHGISANRIAHEIVSRRRLLELIIIILLLPVKRVLHVRNVGIRHGLRGLRLLLLKLVLLKRKGR